MAKSRLQTFLALIVVAVGLLFTAILGLWGYTTLTAPRLHPSPQDVPSVAKADLATRWADAAEQGRQIVRTSLTEQNLPGLSVAVGVGGDIVWAEGFGWADLENKVKVAPDTRYRIGTASKALTSAAAGLLIEKGRLKLDEVIQAYVPAFPEKQWPLTLRQLMGHVGGVRSDRGDEEPLSIHCERAVEGIERFGKNALLFEPGTRYRYSNYGWILVSAAVEAAAAEPLFSFMQRQIFEPLGMNDTTADSGTQPMPNRANFYFPRFAADTRYGPQFPPEEVDYSCFSGSGAIVSTPSDLVRFAMAIAGGRLLKPATVQLLQTSQRLTSGEETGYGLGWDLETATLAGKPTVVVGHDGELKGGMVSSFMTFPTEGIVVSVISNIAYTDTFAVAVKIAEAFAKPANSSAQTSANESALDGPRIGQPRPDRTTE
jgi:serine beta-lactamase-like protein LACTB